VQNHPFIDKVLILKEKNGKPIISDNLKIILAKRFDSCIVVYPTFIASFIIFLSRISRRIGTGYRWYSFFFNSKVYQHRKYAEKHELEFNIQLLENLGIKKKIDRGDIEFELRINGNDNKKIEDILTTEKLDQKKKTIIIHPGSGGSAMDLPIKKFKEIVQLLDEKNKFNIFISGSSAEQELCESIKTSEKIKNFSGRFNLGELTAFINKSDIFISNSTGPLHIAAALGKNVIGFYPKIKACLPDRWGPYSNKSVVFMPEIECSDCNREQCKKLECMNSIDVNKVISAIENIG
jgi:ADP-heptose:LPS heptosyltransferase